MKKKILLATIIFSIFSVVFYVDCNSTDALSRSKKIKNGETKMQAVTQVKASHILVKTKEEAEQIRVDILSGKISFAEAAEKYSSCPSGSKGGDLGFFGRGMMVPEFDQASFSLPVGEVSEPVQTQFGYHLIVVTATK